MQFSDSIYELSPNDFNQGRLKDKRCSVVLFFAPWCGHCQNFKPIYNMFADIYKNGRVCTLDCDEYSEFSSSLNQDYKGLINGFPTVVFFKDGKPHSTFEGQRNVWALIEHGIRVCGGDPVSLKKRLQQRLNKKDAKLLGI